jgi:hypothetical protein
VKEDANRVNTGGNVTIDSQTKLDYTTTYLLYPRQMVSGLISVVGLNTSDYFCSM